MIFAYQDSQNSPADWAYIYVYRHNVFEPEQNLKPN